MTRVEDDEMISLDRLRELFDGIVSLEQLGESFKGAEYHMGGPIRTDPDADKTYAYSSNPIPDYLSNTEGIILQLLWQLLTELHNSLSKQLWQIIEALHESIVMADHSTYQQLLQKIEALESQ